MLDNSLYNIPKLIDSAVIQINEATTELKNYLNEFDPDTSQLNSLETRLDKLNELAKSLFTLNNRKYGPIPGAYMVMCTKPKKEWCVAQLNADRAKPFIIFKDKAFNSIKEAQEEAERMKKERGESAPRRCT